MKNEPDMPRIRELCKARGGVCLSRCTTLRFVPRQLTKEDGRLARLFKLSEQESKDFVEILESTISQNEMGVLMLNKKFCPHLSRFHTRLVENRSGEPSLSSSDTPVV